MADAPRKVGTAGLFANEIRAAATRHETTGQMFDRIRERAEVLGVSLPRDIVTGAARIRSGFTKMTYGSEAIARASDTDALHAGMIGRQAYGRGALGPADVPTWMVDFQLDVDHGSGSSAEWHHLRYVGSLPATVGALQEDIANYSDLLSMSYNVAVGELGSIMIGET
jgi:hypothetical protein